MLNFLIDPEIRRARAALADAETELCIALDTWHDTRGEVHVKARRRLATAILSARTARSAVAQARRQAQLNRDCSGPYGVPA